MDDTGAPEPADAAQSNAARPIGSGRRPAGPAQRRIATAAANDDLPSIGGLIFALQQRPSKSPFLVALFASLVWFVIGGFFSYGLISTQLTAPNGVLDLLANRSALTAAMAILVPIAIFWFLALLVWRAQELRLMASTYRGCRPPRRAGQARRAVGRLPRTNHSPAGRSHERCHLPRHRTRGRAGSPGA